MIGDVVKYIGFFIVLSLLVVELSHHVAWPSVQRSFAQRSGLLRDSDRSLTLPSTRAPSNVDDAIHATTASNAVATAAAAAAAAAAGDVAAVDAEQRRRVAVAVTILAGREAPTTELLDIEGFIDSAGVLAHAVRTRVMRNSRYDIELVALVLPSPKLSPHYAKLRAFGFKIVEETVPIRYSEIAESKYAHARPVINERTDCVNFDVCHQRLLQI